MPPSNPAYDDVINTLFRHFDGSQWKGLVFDKVKICKPWSSNKMTAWSKHVCTHGRAQLFFVF
jgi:hypothetical protein